MGNLLVRWRALGATVVALLSLAAPAALAQTPPSRVVPGSQDQVQLSFAPLVKRVAPGVVNIYTKKTVRTQPSPLLNDPFFRRFFGDQLPGPGSRVQNSLGSGVIVDPAGIIVTNNHVIRGADEIIVAFADRREFEATLLRADERTDLAVLKIEIGDEKLPALELRDSDDLEVGDLVLAIGNPFGVGQTVTSGIVSAVARTMAGIADYRFFIQTDAAINPGNSGGALVAMDGRLIGINTAIYSRDGGSIGIGFAIPSNMVRTVLNGVTAGGKLVRPWLGAAGQTVTPDVASSIGLSRPFGVLVNELYPGGPAERAGLKRGDVVTQVEGREVSDSEALRFRIATQAVGGTVRLTVWREGKDRIVPISLIAPPETPPREATPLRGNHPLAGATVANLSPALADELGLEVGPRGVIILELRRGSPAQVIRLLPGDLLLRINDRELKSVDDVRKATTQVALPWRMVLKRGERIVNFTVGG
jgi:serine protease Do